MTRDPDVFVVLKDGSSHGTADGTPLCAELTEDAARRRKIGRCVRYIPAPREPHAVPADADLGRLLRERLGATDDQHLHAFTAAAAAVREAVEGRCEPPYYRGVKDGVAMSLEEWLPRLRACLAEPDLAGAVKELCRQWEETQVA